MMKKITWQKVVHKLLSYFSVSIFIACTSLFIFLMALGIQHVFGLSTQMVQDMLFYLLMGLLVFALFNFYLMLREEMKDD